MTSGVPIGAHVDQNDPVGAAHARGADLAQFFLGDPQGWKGPRIAHPGGAEGLRAQAAQDGVDLYVHAPYLINVASTNNRIRIPSRKLLQQQIDAATEIDARGLIVHGGHLAKGEDPRVGVDNWCKTLERLDVTLPVLIENTAGGDNAMARLLERVAMLWDGLGARCDMDRVGFCLDTCHAHAGGEDLVGIVDRVKAVTGRIDLVHANGSRDAVGSGADRHTNLESGEIEPDLIVEVVAAADAPVVCETPGGRDGQARDIAFLRSRLPS
ncbi:MAG: deoxyribonuclease IV [Actinomycetota bacterium]|nr:deoxyribonuclease IV [Actinomycetota bacterium]